MNHKERHWQTTQVIILTAAKDIPMTCYKAKSNDKLLQTELYIIFLHWQKIRAGHVEVLHFFYLLFHVLSAPHPLGPAGFPWPVHLCPKDEACRWGSMGSAFPDTSETRLQEVQEAEGAQIQISFSNSFSANIPRKAKLILLSVYQKNKRSYID